MRKVEISSIGKTKETWLQEALAEYEKRLSNVLQIKWTIVSDFKKLQTPYIALDVLGECISSETLSCKLIDLFDRGGSRLRIVIGDADGLDESILAKSMWRWSLSPLTFTHQMTRLILLEQLYRSFAIASGSRYHK